MATTNTSLLDLSTKIERKNIRIDDKLYAIRNMTEFNLIERHEIALAAKVMQGMTRLGEATIGANSAVEAARSGLHETVSRILVGAEEVLPPLTEPQKLTDEQKLMVLNCFFEQAGTTPQKMQQTTAKQLKRQRVSKDSTEEAPTAG